MRTVLLAAAAAVLFLPAASSAADPAITYQTQPVIRILDDARAAIRLVGGEDAVKSFNEGIKSKLGEKGFDGLDITRPVVGFVDVPADPKLSVAVVAFPVSGEKEFLEFCERWNKSKPKAVEGGLYELPAPDPGLQAVMRIADGYAYIATGVKDPARVLDAKNLTPANKLYNPADTSLMSGRINFDRIPKEVHAKMKEGLALIKEPLGKGGPGLGMAEMAIIEPFLQLANQAVILGEGAKEASVRITLDGATGDAAIEFSVTARPGTPLDALISGTKPTMNRFAGLVTPDAVGGVKLQLPLSNEDVRTGLAEKLELLRKEAANNAPPQPRAFLDELLKGLIRTVKAGDVDLGAVLRGPAKDGTFTGVVALTFNDPSGVEKELKKLIETEAPQDFRDAVKWDADKAGTVSIHTIDLTRMPEADGRAIVKALFGAQATVAFAFAPTAVVGAVGPDAIAQVKAALLLKPIASPVIDATVNPSRAVKFAGTIEPRAAAEITKVLGSDDQQLTALSLTVVGGKELKVRLGMNVKVLPRMGASVFSIRSGNAAPPPQLEK